MWALRGASLKSMRVPGLKLAAYRASVGFGTLNVDTEDSSTSCRNPVLSSQTCYYAVRASNQFSVGSRNLSSMAGTKSGGTEEDDLEDGFSELETSKTARTTGEGDIDDDTTSASESDSSGDEEHLDDVIETELLENTEVEVEVEAGEKATKKKRPMSALFKLVLDEPGPSISAALDKHVVEGNDVNRAEIYDALLRLCRLKLYGKALQLLEWVETDERFDFVERDYASKVDLIAKVHGLQKAENYIEKVPKSFRTEMIYRTFLANCVAAMNTRKAEHVFNKMKDLGFTMTSFACNQLLLLYKRTDKKKIADVLLMMEKENLKPSLFTYQLLVDTKGFANDMVGMEQIVDTMKAEGIEPDIRMQASLARHYAIAGLKEKAEAVLKDMEGNDLNSHRWICPLLLPIYAHLGKSDEVERVWKVCESKPQQRDYTAAIVAWGKLKNVEKAEALFNEMLKTNKRPNSSQYSTMLKVYADNKMLTKGKELIKKMGNSGCHIGPVTWDSLVTLYVGAGEVEKADSVLHKAVQQKTLRPLFNSYMTLLDHYARRGDVHNSEKIFHRMRQAGYVSRAKPFHALLQAYINAETPAYGIRERMKADDIFPNKGLAAQLSLVDAFKKSAVSDLLD